MEKDLISIIVPVYKVEKYLRRCVDSIRSQSYQNLEIILVDDGSPDACPSICDEYALADGRVRTVHRLNGGLSTARNSGLSIAKGSYIGFVDSDDFINSDMFENLYHAINNEKADLSICSFNTVNEEGKTISTSLSFDSFKEETISGKDAIRILGELQGVAFVTVWNRLYRTELFESIRFPEGIICEDEFVAHRLFYKCEKVAVIGKRLYNYTIRANSIMTTAYSEKNLAGISAGMDRYSFLMERGLPELAYKTGIRLAYNKIVEGYVKVQDIKLLKKIEPYYHIVIKRMLAQADLRTVKLFMAKHKPLRQILKVIGGLKKYNEYYEVNGWK